jgi:hypothetical protein
MTFFEKTLVGITLFSLWVSLSIFGCKPDDSFLTSGGKPLEFSTDTLRFDTVFTKLGSATRLFKIYNRNSKALLISEIKIANSGQGFFNLNVDGRPGNLLKDIEVPAKDSIYVFAEVKINPNDDVANSPFVIGENIEFTTNGNKQKVHLEAFGQNAVYIPSKYAKGKINQYNCQGGDWIWDDSRPYVIYGVLIINGCNIKIPAGARIHVHGGVARQQNPGEEVQYYNDGILFLVNGSTLSVEGTKEKPVIIEGDRLEPEFKDVTGQWAGIRVGTGCRADFTHAEIKNSLVGVRVDSAATLVMKYSKVHHTAGSGVVGIHSEIYIDNCLFYENGQNAVQQEYGGFIRMRYVSMANFGNRAPALSLNNVLCEDQLCQKFRIFPLEAEIENSVILGSDRDEISLVDKEGTRNNFKYTMNNCAVRIDQLNKPRPSGSGFLEFFDNCKTCINWNGRDRTFKSLNKFDYSPDTLSILSGNARPVLDLQDDFFRVTRDPSSPDIGAIERLLN